MCYSESISNQLSSNEIKLITNALGIKINKKPDAKGWITIKSPLREEENPSFGFNVETGAWNDFATRKRGDIVFLIMYLKGFDVKEAIAWIRDLVQLPVQSNKATPVNEEFQNTSHKTIPGEFRDHDTSALLSEAHNQLINNRNHPLIEIVRDYDCLSFKTLKRHYCGLIKKWGKQWLAIPYQSGIQLYRREDSNKVIRCLEGSKPALSFYGVEMLSGDKNWLFIAKSPREAMLIRQEFGHQADVIGLATGEMGKLTNEQRTWLESQISDANYHEIIILLDCDSDVAFQTAKELSQNVKKLSGNTAVSFVNLYEKSGGDYKDITDCKRDGMSNDLLLDLLLHGEKIEEEAEQETNPIMVHPEDLKLSDSLIDLLPPVVKNYLKYSAPLSDVPNEFLLTPFIATAGAVIGNRRYVELGGIQIYPTIWTVLFAGSSTLRKSTALSLARKPFKPIEEHYRQEYESKLLEWEQRRDNAEMNGESFDEPKPIKKTIYAPDGFSDRTFWESLRDNGSQISNVSEFTALWNELTRPRNSMRDLVLDIFDTRNKIRRNTICAGDIELETPVWCMAGATTIPNFQRTLTSTERASGLLQRILPVCMEQRTKVFKALTELPKPNAELYKHITEQTKKLIDLERRAVALTTEADERFTKWSHDIHNRAEQLTERLPDIGGYVSRLDSYAMKFALIFQQLHRPDQPISGKNMEAAIALAEWLFNHILYMLDKNYIFNKYYADRVKIRELIGKQSDGKMSRTDLMNMSNFDKDQLNRALASEIEAGKIEEIETETGGRPLREYKLTTPT